MPRQVATLSPLTASLGCALTIPLASLVDYCWHGARLAWGDAAGAVGVLAGFAMLVCADGSGEKEAAGGAAVAAAPRRASDESSTVRPSSPAREAATACRAVGANEELSAT